MNKLIPIALGAAVVIGGGAWLATNQTTSQTAISPISPAVAQDANMELAPDMTLGEEDAPVTLIEYASFTCPHCADFHERVFEDLKTDYIDTGKVQFVHREVYFDRFGLMAAQIARCGGEDRYFGIADMIYSGQEDWIGSGQPDEITENLTKIGKVAGLSEDEIGACLADEEKQKAMIAAFQTNASADEVEGTPTLIINGEKYSNMTYEDLTEILDGLVES
ncbi:DsbA family protein [Maritimibacter dapengensis]|uniref:DsbA family protein n=1 Tax=Maritimibacter dapengensis TaxID=2836868 RepID=A0ABS6T4W0_9RHOB|nr:DsbA family protein [Maritimibacter dapengensis]MBV7380225.1 DsbA family protein [Maritimibacter dapengensis]